MGMIVVTAPIQVIAGDLHGLNTQEHQPVKILAIEGHFESYPDGAPLFLVGLPDQAAGTVRYPLAIPRLGSLILHHSLSAPIEGLETVPREEWPPVPVVFWSFRIMVGLGFLMLTLGVVGLLARLRGRLHEWRNLHRFAGRHGPGGFVAVIAGWVTTEVGRRLHGLRPAQDRRVRFAARRSGGGLLAPRLRRRVLHGLFGGRLVHLAADGPCTGDGRARTGERRGADPHRRHHAGVRDRPGPRARHRREREVRLDLPTLWAFILAFAVFAYVVLDGFDLGIGILFPTLERGSHRGQAMNTVAPVWDGNETWLVMGGGSLLAAFPLAYAIIMPALYAPIIAMLLALIFRGVAFEFRWRDPGHQRFWDVSFAGGSIVAAFAQGVTLGALLQGITVEGRQYAGGWWDWLSPFSLLTGFSLVVGYALLGSTWLIVKTEGELQEHAFRHARLAGIGTVICIAAVSVLTPSSGRILRHWLPARVLYTAPGAAARRHRDGGARRQPAAPLRAAAFFLALALFALSMAGWASASSPTSCRAPSPSMRRRARIEPHLHARRRRRPHPDHPCLHRLFLLDFPRQGQSRGLPLSTETPGPVWQRLLWFVGLWAAGVATVAAVGYAIRWWLL